MLLRWLVVSLPRVVLVLPCLLVLLLLLPRMYNKQTSYKLFVMLCFGQSSDRGQAWLLAPLPVYLIYRGKLVNTHGGNINVLTIPRSGRRAERAKLGPRD